MPFSRLIAPALLLAAAAGAQENQQPHHPGRPEIAVSAEGEARAVPDRAIITVGVQTRAATAAAAASRNAEIQSAVLDTLRKLGFSAEQLTTSNYSVHPEMQYDREGQNPRVVAYVVSNTVRVDVHRLSQAGQVIDAALAKGANQVHGLNFYLSNPSPSRQEAITDAFARARADAEALARAAGGTLGPVIQLTTSAAGSGPVFPKFMEARAAMDAAATPITPGEETVRASVTARWVFLPH